MKVKPITVDIELDMQELYNGLIIYKKSIEAQIETLAKEPSICTHQETEEIVEHGVTICANKYCNRIISSTKYDWVY